MTVVRLTARAADAPSIGAELLRPDALPSTEREIAGMPLRSGSAAVAAGDLFSVRVEARDGEGGVSELRVEPGNARLDGLGAGMRAGRLVVEGDAGDRLAQAMLGGEVRVRGSAGHWAGAEMAGGTLRVEGDAGDRLGGALAGAPRGMTGGAILVRGSAGYETGAAMRRGLIAVGGNVRSRAGFRAIAGTIVVLGDAGEAPALATKRGSLVVFGAVRPLPTFREACDYAPVYLRLLLRHLSGALEFDVPSRFQGGAYRRYVGDFTQLGKGEILAWHET